MKTVLIFAHECAPYHRSASTIGAQRPAQFAKYLPAAGWRAIVICCDKQYRRTAKKKDIPKIVDTALQQIDVADNNTSIIIATPSLMYNSWVDRGWISLVKTNEGGSFSKRSPLTSPIRKSLTFLKLFTGDYSESWQPVALAVASAIREVVNIDIVIAEHGPDASLFLARSFSKKYKLPWITDFRDPILRPFIGLKRTLYRIFSRHLLKTAKATINVTPYWQALDEAHFHLPSYLVTNGFDKDEFINRQPEKNTNFVISYFGSYNTFQDIELFLKGFKLAVETLKGEGINNLIFLYRGLKHNDLLARAKKYSIEENLNSKDHVPREVALSEMLNSNMVLLLAIAPTLIDDLYFKKGLYPGKVFEYFGSGRPILSVPSDNGILDDLIESTGTGQIGNDEQIISKIILDAYQGWKISGAVEYKPNMETVTQYTRSNQARILAGILNSSVS